MQGCTEESQASVDGKGKGCTLSMHTGDSPESLQQPKSIHRSKNCCMVMPAACQVSGNSRRKQQACLSLAFGNLQPMGRGSGTQRGLPVGWWTCKGEGDGLLPSLLKMFRFPPFPSAQPLVVPWTWMHADLLVRFIRHAYTWSGPWGQPRTKAHAASKLPCL